MYRSILLVVFLMFFGQSYGQNEENQTNKTNTTSPEKEEQRSILHLKGGAKLEVSILEWDLEKGVTAITIWGQEMFFPDEKILKVTSYSNKAHYSPYRFNEKGVYYALYGGIISGNHGERLNGTNGYTISFSSGFRFSRLFSIGLGTGLDQYAHKSGEKIHPIFLDFRSFLFPKNTTIVANLQVGYGLAFDDDIKGIVESRGGFMFYPNIGLSFGGSETKYSFDIGYKFQNASWTYASSWDIRNRTEYRMDYKRFVMRFGIVL